MSAITRRGLIAAAPAAVAASTIPIGASALHQDAELLALRPGWLSTLADFQAAMRKDEADPDYEEVETRTSDANGEVVDRVTAIPARTMAGIRFKIEVSADWEHGRIELTESIMADILALGS